MHEEKDEVDPNWFGAPEDQPFKKNTVAKDTTSPTPVVESSTAKTPPAPVPQPEPVAAVSDEQMAWRLENGGAAAYVRSAVTAGLGEVGDINVVHQYVTSMSKKCDVDDPLQRMLLEQILIGYHRLGALHESSSRSRTPEAAVAYNGAAVKLLAELRKSMLTLRELQQMPLGAGVFIQQVVER